MLELRFWRQDDLGFLGWFVWGEPGQTKFFQGHGHPPVAVRGGLSLEV